MKNETFVTAAMLKELGYYFTNPDDEKLFLLFVNELLAENIGQRLVSQLPLKAKVDLLAQYEFDPAVFIRILIKNHIEPSRQIECAWEELREELLTRRSEVLRIANKNHLYKSTEPPWNSQIPEDNTDKRIVAFDSKNACQY
ncbi:MAG: hypothetical protein J6H31_07745 [Butyrivibrio sp.]|nr:hypothetical protein [Butyrivibrio sp.]